MNFRVRSLWVIVLLAGLLSCQQRSTVPVPTDTPEQGSIWISADESFRPVVEELVQVYQSIHPQTHIQVQYKPEADCFQDLLVDSIRMVIVARRPSPAEKKWLTDSIGGLNKSRAVARDGVAVIAHPSQKKLVWTKNELRELLSGKINNTLIPVVDGLKATSTVRFLIDTLLKGEPPSPQLMAARTSQAVIEYVADHPNVIGFVGVSWIGNREDSLQRIWQPRVKMLQVVNDQFPTYHFLPDQFNIHTQMYPLTRDIIYLLREKQEGLGTGLARFMESEGGQLIFKRAYLAPLLKDFDFRPVQLRE
ncbi:MAG: phosphate ABC transporter substrate-binding protein, PhoT family [Bacteroidetes bacterium]|nr:phosphate ABC transporter substrate-binding protein, PhoT family [Bacteroidota bacterium]